MTDPQNEDDEMTLQVALDRAIQQRAHAQARWPVITPIVESLREIRKEDHFGEMFGAAFREGRR